MFNVVGIELDKLLWFKFSWIKFCKLFNFVGIFFCNLFCERIKCCSFVSFLMFVGIVFVSEGFFCRESNLRVGLRRVIFLGIVVVEFMK